MTTETFHLESKFLGKTVSFLIFFPANYTNCSSEFPVLYLLHGLFGSSDNWLTNTKIIEYAEECSFIIVCPEGENSWYANTPHLENHFYESYFLRELIPCVEKKFNVGVNRAQRAIAGLSMGGYGAFKFAFRRPEIFCFAASMSGAFHAAEIFGDDFWAELQPSILAIFRDDRLLRADNDLFQIVKKFPAERCSELPFFYFDCGAEDSFLSINVRLAKEFRRRGIEHEFNIFSGGHDWNYWNAQLENILRNAEKFLK